MREACRGSAYCNRCASQQCLCSWRTTCQGNLPPYRRTCRPLQQSTSRPPISVATVRVPSQSSALKARRSSSVVHYYIRPPRRHFVFSYLHGISWNDVVDAPAFRQLWLALQERFAGVEFLAAHNASFDRSVLRTCCEQARLSALAHSFQCTVRLVRTVWNIYPTTLPDVCRHLHIPLRHHDARSDAEACARIVIAALEAGVLLPSRSSPPGRRHV
jgi:DNA polymerase III subunit epsilon